MKPEVLDGALRALRPIRKRVLDAWDRHDEARYHNFGILIETMNCGLLVRDLDGVIHFTNDRFNEWLGYESGELDGKSITLLIPKEQEPLLQHDLAEIAAGDLRARLLTVRRKDGTTFPALTLPQLLLDEAGNHVGGVGVMIDLGSVQTAVPLGVSAEDPRAVLSRIASELQTLSLRASFPVASAATLEHPELAMLSDREREVLSHLIQGDRVPAIAKRLHISPHTVRNHLKSMYSKLDVGNQSQLIDYIRTLAEPAGGAPSGS